MSHKETKKTTSGIPDRTPAVNENPQNQTQFVVEAINSVKESFESQLNQTILALVSDIKGEFKNLRDEFKKEISDSQEIMSQQIQVQNDKLEAVFTLTTDSPARAGTPITNDLNHPHESVLEARNLQSVQTPSAGTELNNLREILRRKTNRSRDSIMANLLTFEPEENEQKVILQTDKHLSIKWRDKTIDGFMEFLERIIEFELSYNVKIQALYSHFDPDLQKIISNILRAQHPTIYNSVIKVYKASAEDLMEAVQIHFAPKGLDHFNKLLSSSCEKYKVEQIGGGYGGTRMKLYNLKTKFSERYEFLVNANKLSKKPILLPAVNFKQGGILPVWMALTPEHSREPFTNLLINDKFESLDLFFVKFFDIVEETFRMGELIIEYRTRIGSVKIFNPEQPKNMQKGYNNYYKSQDKKRGLNLINDDDEWDRYEELERQFEEHPEEFVEDFAEDVETEPVNAIVQSRPAEKSKFQHQQPRQFQPRDTYKRTPNNGKKEICFRYLVTDRCDAEPCRYSHDAKEIQVARQEILEKWRTADKDETPQQVRSIVKRPIFKTRNEEKGVKDHRRSFGRGLNYLSDGDDSDDEELETLQERSSKRHSQEVDDQSLNIVASLFLTESDSKYWKATHREAIIKFPGESNESIIGVALFDTGAEKSNYISNKMIEDHNLHSFTIPCRQRCRVANGELIKINGKIRLEVRFNLNDGRGIAAELFFYILHGLAEELIIGVPDIIEHFCPLFAEMLTLNFIEAINKKNELIEPWTVKDEISEEEKSIPIPTSFQDVMFLRTTYEKALEEYQEELPSRISEDFKKETPVLEFLQEVGQQAFVAESWDGVNGVPPVELEFKEDMPQSITPYRPKVAHNLVEPYKLEMKKLTVDFYKPSDSSIASPIVIAPKATYPFIRICGDYRKVNKYLKVPKYPIPSVLDELRKIANFKIYIDLDVTSAFHQIPISEATGRILSVQTPTEQLQPRFLPEGVSPASLILMKVMNEIFHDFLNWMIVIHDNMLVLAIDYQDAFNKLVKVINRCIQRNLYLKLSKSRFGVTEVEFFGYVCSANTYRLSDERRRQVSSLPFPIDVKGMQRFLGMANYFKPFIYNYSQKTALLTDMIHKDFSWKKETWDKDYEKTFEEFKKEILHSLELYYPNPSLDWYLFVDASEYCVGGVLIQRTHDNVQQVIALVSKKLEPAARKWSTIEKEAFGMFYVVSQLKAHLQGKSFVMLTDHRNLLWIEASEVPKIIRIRMYLQLFDFKLMHIPGKQNVFADYLSRAHEDEKVPSGLNNLLHDDTPIKDVQEVDDKVKTMLKQVHNSRMGHNGLRRTWLLLNKHFPGHSIPHKVISDFISTCPACQKFRLSMCDSLPPPIRVIDGEHRHQCGYDLLYVTPEDEEGYKYLHVIKLLPSRIIGLYPSKDLTAESLALALFQFFVNYGVNDVLVTDPGSNIDSKVTKLLLQWFGIRLKMSLVNRHQSNAVERSHREILKFLSMLVNEERIRKSWSKPSVLGIIQFMLNNNESAETGKTPFEYLFGSLDAKYLKLPDVHSSIPSSNKFLSALNDNIRTIREAAAEVTAKIQGERKKEAENTYQVGDLVLLNDKLMNIKKDKLSPTFSGPYVITNIYKADISIQHVVTKMEKIVHMENIKPYFSDSKKEAFEAGLVDQHQFVVERIMDFAGDPETRTTMKFKIKFADGDVIWVPYSKDLVNNEQFIQFCKENVQLKMLLYTTKEWESICVKLRQQPIKSIQPGMKCFIDLRAWGFGYYLRSGLPINELEMKKYVVECDFVEWKNAKQTRVKMCAKIFNQEFFFSNVEIERYGLQTEFDSEKMILVDEALCEQYPNLLKK